MKTKELANLLVSVSPCLEGLKRLLSYRTVKEWWDNCEVGGDLAYLWLFVATADFDNVFALELQEFEVKNCGSNQPISNLMDDIHAFRAGDRRMPDSLCFDFDADDFRSVFRCPTDAELRMAGKYFLKRGISVLEDK